MWQTYSSGRERFISSPCFRWRAPYSSQHALRSRPFVRRTMTGAAFCRCRGQPAADQHLCSALDQIAQPRADRAAAADPAAAGTPRTYAADVRYRKASGGVTVYSLGGNTPARITSTSAWSRRLPSCRCGPALLGYDAVVSHGRVLCLFTCRAA